MLSSARRPLATGCVFNKSNKAFIWLAVCSLELASLGDITSFRLLTCEQGGAGWGPGEGQLSGWEKPRLRRPALSTEGDRWCLGQCPKT